MAKIWTYKGSQYKLYKTPKTFNKAAQAAANSGGYLAEIDNIDENKEIHKQLSDLISTSEFSSTTSQDGGGSAYVWIGGSDQNDEGSWQWENSKKPISLTRKEWGSGALGEEPDGGTFQNGLGLGLENWPKGSKEGNGFGNAGSWNDINTSSKLFYIVEKDLNSPTEGIEADGPREFIIKAPKKFKKNAATKIKDFDISKDLIQIDTASFGIDDIIDPATAEQGKGKKAVNKLAKQDFDFLYDQKKGGIYFNKNGADKGFGEGGIIAILKGAPELTASNVEFI